MHSADLFDLTLKDRAGETALEYCGRKRTFGQLDESSNRLAHYLTQIGYRSGDRLGVYLENCVELIEAYLACAKLGVIFAPINALYREREIGHIVADSEPKSILTNRSGADRLPAGSSIVLTDDLSSLLRGQPTSRPPCPATGDSIALLVYTSGTTGRPKGAALTHNNLAVNALTLNTCWKLSPSDRMLVTLPLFHVNGIANALYAWLTAGFRMRLLDRFRKETILDEFLDFQPTFFFGVPTMYRRLLAASPAIARKIGERARLFVSGAAPLRREEFEQFRDSFGHAILERYGMTEALGMMANPHSGERRPGTVGKPLPGVSVRLSEETHGEVLVKGATVFAGYWRNDQATRDAFTPDGYFRTGDLAEQDGDGYFQLCGRRGDLIISGGFNIYPREIEELLEAHPRVSEAVVVGEPDAIKGERPVAYLVLEAGSEVDEGELCDLCQRSLASYKTPREFRFVPALPRNALGKIQRHELSIAQST